MVDIILGDEQTGYSAVREYALRYKKHNPLANIVVVSHELSDDGESYELTKDIVFPLIGTVSRETLYFDDWWDGQKNIKLFGIRSVDELNIDGGIYEE